MFLSRHRQSQPNRTIIAFNYNVKCTFFVPAMATVRGDFLPRRRDTPRGAEAESDTMEEACMSLLYYEINKFCWNIFWGFCRRRVGSHEPGCIQIRFFFYCVQNQKNCIHHHGRSSCTHAAGALLAMISS